ncbi:MAG TPA: anaerobic glycerol-3-phosphate dehydrogenase subunit GlpA [Kouleothrix sp.]|uniref:anaerobic glycerol-3-phosphate dehydrogenase subunit GlpA n=1 Tax=Kouleothrix sp. TaxID=2779161 RepID=UPI002CA52A52|nr:anaerobic glycerol-3-phosphate dehydrogenase subunit GlpA [Kouleothrix sp.]HRC76581.1 anaerobic glycerol-3-phosphate dehydrogenase subunit GlpA [Kouleothrix sp.]
MRTITTDVLVIGGGATGLGVLRDMALRGIRAALVEKGDLTHGTSGRYHGLLHSGGRYVVKDKQSATECAHENEILRKIMPHCLEDTGGFFVVTPADDEGYVPRFLAGCSETGVPVNQISVREALRREPLLNPRISHVFEVRDGAADSFLAAHSNAEDAIRHGAQVLTYHVVKAIERDGDRVAGAVCEDMRTGEEVRFHTSYIVNAAGAWAGKIAELAGVQVTVVPGKGTMIAMNHRVLNTVVNRCKPPADGDIIVPIRTVAVIGTTDVHVPDPDVFGIEAWEVERMLHEGEQLVPGISKARVLRAWAGVRPLYKDQDAADDRDIPRTYKLLDHEARDGVKGFISIVGGKWTTYRMMAQEATDAVAAKLGNSAPCRTHLEPLPVPPGTEKPAGGSRDLFWLGKPLATVEADNSYGDLICECELVTRDRVIGAITTAKASNIDDIRRDTRLGMGPCQGGFCTYRAVALWNEFKRASGAPLPEPEQASAALLRHFLQERWKGITVISWGDQLRQARLDEIIFLDTLGVDLLPQPAPAGQNDSTMVTAHPAIATEYHTD